MLARFLPLFVALLLLPSVPAATYQAEKKVMSPHGIADFEIISLNSTTDGFAAGSCQVHVPDGTIGLFLCGTDRDDDLFITNSDPHPDGTASFDDDFVTGWTYETLPLCFERDLGNADPVNAADNDWDDVIVRIQPESYGSLLAPFGSVTASLQLTTSANLSCTPSGH